MRIDKLIAATHGKAAARAHRHYTPPRSDIERAGIIGRDVLSQFDRIAGACSGLSAMYATDLGRMAGFKAYVVAGTLFADGHRVFGNGKPFDGKAVFSTSNMSWDGHVWVMIGPYVADISIGWTARLGGAAPLAALVHREMGPNAGLIIMKWQDAPLSGLTYSPQYVLTDDQVEILNHSARTVFPKAVMILS
jgi:hypothetical protein